MVNTTQFNSILLKTTTKYYKAPTLPQHYEMLLRFLCDLSGATQKILEQRLAQLVKNIHSAFCTHLIGENNTSLVVIDTVILKLGESCKT